MVKATNTYTYNAKALLLLFNLRLGNTRQKVNGIHVTSHSIGLWDVEAYSRLTDDVEDVKS
jgi:hypothetical protein